MCALRSGAAKWFQRVKNRSAEPAEINGLKKGGRETEPEFGSGMGIQVETIQKKPLVLANLR